MEKSDLIITIISYTLFAFVWSVISIILFNRRLESARIKFEEICENAIHESGQIYERDLNNIRMAYNKSIGVYATRSMELSVENEQLKERLRNLGFKDVDSNT